MTNIFELKAQLAELESDMTFHHTIVSSLVTARNRELFDLWKSANNKQLIHLATKSGEAFDELFKLVNDSGNNIDVDLEAVKKYAEAGYSNLNAVIELKKFCKRKEEVLKELQHARIDTRNYLKQLKQLKNELDQLNSKTAYDLLTRIDDWVYDMRELLAYDISYFNLIMFFEFLFIQDNTLSKNDVLSLTVIDKSLETKQYLDSLPEQIDYKTFSDMFFVHNVEDDNYNWIGRIFRDELMHKRDTNPRFKAKTDEMLEEITRDIPTYTVTHDIFGDIDSITQNYPKLRLV